MTLFMQVANTGPLRPTQPQPFNLHGKKRKQDSVSSDEKYVSMAEKEKAFFQQTPDRFRSKPLGKGNHCSK